MYLFYNFCTTLHFPNDHGLYTAEEYSKSWTPDGERNGRSKNVELYKNCGINTYRKGMLLVYLYNYIIFCSTLSYTPSSEIQDHKS